MSPNVPPSVFVVDDDEAAADSVAALMSAVGFSSVVFHSAEEFLEKFDGSQSGCLILDIRLTGMSGLALYELMRERGWKIPTIFISGHADPSISDDLIKRGAVGCLEKPYAGEDLCRMVKVALGHPGPGAS